MQIHDVLEKTEGKETDKRLGRGNGSGKGTYCGRGVKGQKARSGFGFRMFFAGGQMPLIRKIPKVGFNNSDFRTEYAVVNVGRLDRFDDGTELDPERLEEEGLVRPDKGQEVKILGDGELNTSLIVRAHAFSSSAREQIEEAGGDLETISGTSTSSSE